MDDTSVSPPTPPAPPSSTASAGPLDTRNHIVRAAIIWAVCTVVAIVVFILVAPHFSAWHILPQFASQTSNDIYSVMFLFTLLSIPVFFMVVVFGFYSGFNFTRGRPAAGGAFRPPRSLPVIWIIISFVLVTFLYVYGLTFLSKVDAQPASDALIVNVTGEQWLWDYSYPQYGNAQSTVLELPVNRSVVFHIQSIDVQHSFWIPAFGIKEDAVPGEMTSISTTPTVMGTYVVRCAELCGLYHAYMQTPVYVVSELDFNTWITQQPTPVPPSSSSLIQPNALPAETAMRIGGFSSTVAEG
jgi:cytochrome c oxidase subunit II